MQSDNLICTDKGFANSKWLGSARMMGQISKMTLSFFGRALFWTVAIATLILLIHLYTPSMMQMNEQEWKDIATYHRTLDAFRVRPLVTGLATGIEWLTGFSFKLSFFILQFALLIIAGPIIAGWHRSLGLSERESIGGMAVFLLSLPVAMAFFEPVFTWSDFFCYVAIPIALSAAVQGRLTIFVCAILACILEREVNIVFLVVGALIAVKLGRARHIRVVIACAFVIIGFVVVRLLLSGTNSGSPQWMLSFNFDGFLRTRDSLFSIWVSLGAIWVFGLLAVASYRKSDSQQNSLLVLGSVILIVTLMPASILLGKIRESRLLMPIAFFLIPLSMSYLRNWKIDIRLAIGEWGIVKSILIVASAIAVGTLLSKLIFPDFDYRRWKDGNWLWSGMHIAAVLLFGLMYFRRKRSASTLSAE